MLKPDFDYVPNAAQAKKMSDYHFWQKLGENKNCPPTFIYPCLVS